MVRPEDDDKAEIARREHVSGEHVSGMRDARRARDRERDSDVECVPMQELGLAPGVVVADTYRIVRALGAGGMGVVTLAHDERLDRDVAVKFVRPELFKLQKLRDALLHEARAMARVSHPNVLTVYSFGDHDGTPYFAMEYVEGLTVEQWLADRAEDGPPDVGEAMRIFEQACLGV
jgi:serine/threonine-protein kinase